MRRGIAACALALLVAAALWLAPLMAEPVTALAWGVLIGVKLPVASPPDSRASGDPS